MTAGGDAPASPPAVGNDRTVPARPVRWGRRCVTARRGFPARRTRAAAGTARRTPCRRARPVRWHGRRSGTARRCVTVQRALRDPPVIPPAAVRNGPDSRAVRVASPRPARVPGACRRRRGRLRCRPPARTAWRAVDGGSPPGTGLCGRGPALRCGAGSRAAGPGGGGGASEGRRSRCHPPPGLLGARGRLLLPGSAVGGSGPRWGRCPARGSGGGGGDVPEGRRSRCRPPARTAWRAWGAESPPGVWSRGSRLRVGQPPQG